MIAYAYDDDQREADELFGALFDGLGLGDAGFEVVVVHNRTELLDLISAVPEPSIAFIDLQRREPADTAYAGHRLIETIRRHPQLCQCRPVAFTAYGYPDVVDLVRKHGAYGLIDRHWVDALRDLAELPTLHEVLARILDETPRAVHDQDAFFVRLGRGSEAREDGAIYEVFADTPPYTGEASFWPMMRHLAAEHLGLTAVAHLTHAEFPDRSITTYGKRLEAMPDKLAPAYAIGDRVQHRAAQALLQLAPHRRKAPDESVSLVHLAKVRRFAAFTDEQRMDATTAEIVRASYLDREALDALRCVTSALPPTTGRQDAHLHVEMLRTTLAKLDPDSHGQALIPPLIRAVNGILDARHAREAR